MKKNNLFTTLLVAVFVGVIGFYSGTVYQKSKKLSRNPGQYLTGPSGSNRPNGTTRLGMGMPVSGEITSLENNTLTVKTKNGSSKNVIYSSSTTINKTIKGAVQDLVVGEQIMVIGKEDTSGILTAQTISVGVNIPKPQE